MRTTMPDRNTLPLSCLKIKPLALAVSALSLYAGSVVAGELDVRITEITSNGIAIDNDAGVSEGAGLLLSLESLNGDLDNNTQAVNCTVSGRVVLDASSSASNADFEFANGGNFSYEVNFSDTGRLTSDKTMLSVDINYDNDIEEEEFSVVVEEGSIDVECDSNLGDEPIEILSEYAGYGKRVAIVGGYAFDLYKIAIADVEAPEVPDIEQPGIPALSGAEFLKTQLETATNLTIQNSHARTRSIARELARRRNYESGFSADNLSIRLNGHSFTLGQYRSNADDDGSANIGRWGGFVSGSIEVGELDDDSGELEFGSSMVTAGVDIQTKSWVMGLAVTTNSSSADIETIKDATELTQSGISAFASFYSEGENNIYLDFILSSSTSTYEFTRAFDAMGNANGETDGKETGIAFGAGFEGRIESFDYSIFLLYDYLDIEVDGYREQAGSMNGFAIDQFSRYSQMVELGTRFDYTFNSSVGVFVPFASLSYRDELEEDNWLVKVSLDGTSGQLTGLNQEDGYVSAGLGISAVFPRGISAYAGYETDLQLDRWKIERYDLGLRWEF